MSKRKRDSGGGGGDNWLNTYADMVTLLLTFFAVLLSMSNTDEVKFNAFVESFSNLPQEVIEEVISTNSTSAQGDTMAVQATEDIEDLYQSIKKYVSENNQEEVVETYKVDNVIYIRFSSSMFFEPNSYALRSGSKPILKFVGKGLKDREESIRMVNVIGYTATVKNATFWILSGDRAAIVARHFDVNCDFPPDKLTVVGYGNQYPVAPNDTEENRKKNRRVEMVIIGSNADADFDLTDALGEFYDSNKYPTKGSGEDVYQPKNGLKPVIEEGVSPYDEATEGNIKKDEKKDTGAEANGEDVPDDKVKEE